MRTDGGVLLDRDTFRARVLARCGGRCCVPGCAEAAADAHHIVERRLWPDGGYYLDNGAPLCGPHHLMAETTEIGAQQLRDWCGIRTVLLPPQFEDGEPVDKWGNPILPNGMRMRGELWEDEAARKALARGGMLDRFTFLCKYPKTWHVGWSPGRTKGDRVLGSTDHFAGRRVVVTRKMDGENSTLMRDHMHARSLDGRHHPSRDWLKGFWAGIRHDIPEGWRVCGENLYAVHSVRYDALPSWFLGFSVWDERNACLPWDATLEWFDLLGIEPVPVLYDGLWDEAAVRALHDPGRDDAANEGYVIRVADGFRYAEFRHAVAKYVRAGHVQTDDHWMHGEIVANGLAAPAPRP